MLPGFRFLFAATFLTLSILVFGLGAAALLRAAHEQFATNPSWHAAPEATFAQQVEPARPVLAMLRVGTPAADQKASGDTPGADASAIPAPAESTPAERAATVQPPAEPTTIAALKPEPPTLPAAAKSDMAAPESPASAARQQRRQAMRRLRHTTKVATPTPRRQRPGRIDGPGLAGAGLAAERSRPARGRRRCGSLASDRSGFA